MPISGRISEIAPTQSGFSSPAVVRGFSSVTLVVSPPSMHAPVFVAPVAGNHRAGRVRSCTHLCVDPDASAVKCRFCASAIGELGSRDNLSGADINFDAEFWLAGLPVVPPVSRLLAVHEICFDDQGPPFIHSGLYGMSGGGVELSVFLDLTAFRINKPEIGLFALFVVQQVCSQLAVGVVAGANELASVNVPFTSLEGWPVSASMLVYPYCLPSTNCP